MKRWLLAMACMAGVAVVALITPENRLHFVTVQLGRDLGNRQEILDGLKGGDLLVSNPGDMLAVPLKLRVDGP